MGRSFWDGCSRVIALGRWCGSVVARVGVWLGGSRVRDPDGLAFGRRKAQRILLRSGSSALFFPVLFSPHPAVIWACGALLCSLFLFSSSMEDKLPARVEEREQRAAGNIESNTLDAEAQ